MGTKTALFSRKQSGGIFTIVDQSMTTGDIWFVDSNCTGGGTTSGYGRNPDSAFTTLASALAQATASKGDIIYVMPGHAETLTAALAVNVAGIKIIGLGNGSNRPTFTLTGQVPAFNVKGANTTISNLAFYSATASTSYAMNLMRVAASNVLIAGCEFKINQKMYHTVRIVSGDNVRFEDCVFLNTYAPGAGAAGIKAQDCILNIGGTKVVVLRCRFNDISADAAHKWKACVEGGKLTASLTVEECTFVCRGIATRTRTAAASGFMATLYCRGISPSSNTAVGAIFTPTFQYIVETYNVAAVNKVGVVTVTTSDLRLKRNVVSLNSVPFRKAA